MSDWADFSCISNNHLLMGTAHVLQLEGGKRLKRELMPDALHPNGAGMQAIAECIHDTLQLAIPNLPVIKS